MSIPFSAHQGLIVVDVELEGPAATALLRLALDTGATQTMISVSRLLAIGYDPAVAPQRVRVMTGSGVLSVPSLPVTRLNALGKVRNGFFVLAHTLPPNSTVDGLLGLNFLRGLELNINFRTGLIDLQ